MIKFYVNRCDFLISLTIFPLNQLQNEALTENISVEPTSILSSSLFTNDLLEKVKSDLVSHEIKAINDKKLISIFNDSILPIVYIISALELSNIKINFEFN